MGTRGNGTKFFIGCLVAIYLPWLLGNYDVLYEEKIQGLSGAIVMGCENC